MISPQETGYLVTFGGKDFQESFNWACTLSGLCFCLPWPKSKWLNQHDKAWRLRSGKKELIFAYRSNHQLLKYGLGWTERGTLMSLKMFLGMTQIQRLPKTLQSTSCLSQSPGNCADKGESPSTELSWANDWVSKRRKTTSISSTTAKVYQFCVLMSDRWLPKVNCDEWSTDWDPCVANNTFFVVLRFMLLRRIIFSFKYESKTLV